MSNNENYNSDECTNQKVFTVQLVACMESDALSLLWWYITGCLDDTCSYPFCLRFCQTQITWLQSFSAILPLSWYHVRYSRTSSLCYGDLRNAIMTSWNTLFSRKIRLTALHPTKRAVFVLPSKHSGIYDIGITLSSVCLFFHLSVQ